MGLLKLEINIFPYKENLEKLFNVSFLWLDLRKRKIILNVIILSF